MNIALLSNRLGKPLSLPSWLRGPSQDFRKARWDDLKQCVSEFGLNRTVTCYAKLMWMDTLSILSHVTCINRTERAQPHVLVQTTSPRERLGLSLMMLGAIGVTFMASTGSTAMSSTSITSFVTPKAPVLPQPVNWLNGTANEKGSRDAVVGAFNYATVAGYTFAADASDVSELVGNDTLVKLEGKYLELIDVSEPYVLPAVATFTNRLAKQYAAKGCGKLIVTSGLRTIAVQETLANGSNQSVHPTGMSIDLRRIHPSNTKEAYCLERLEDLLKDVEAERRIDVTFEESPRHFHVVVVPQTYENWMKLLKPSLDPEVEALATALFFEGAFNESDEGYQAIAAVIKNRARSSEFPNTILEVVAEGAAGRNAGGCQFSFMCDGRAEKIQLLCGQHPEDTKVYWEAICLNRWQTVVKIAERLINDPTDPTGGAVSYYAASMDKAPYWAQSDMKRGTIRTIGSHVFACSNYRGSDACEKGGL